ncbi:beta-lactamase-like protein, partial [Gongronella butleri]
DVVLFSHSDLVHLGAYAYAKHHLGLACPAYATVPVVNMGKMCLYDVYQSKANEMEFDTFTLEDVDNAFDKITPLRYSQPIALPGKCLGITITAYAAAHSVGGTIWKIKQDTNDIVYAVDFNHRKESHLDGTVLLNDGVILDALSRPSLLITDALNANVMQAPRRDDRHAALFDTITTTLSNGGSVLLPADSAARVLELSYLLDQHWASRHVNYPLIMLSHTSYHTVHFAKIMLEWMRHELTKHFSQTRENPFEFKYLRLCHKLQDLDDYPGPKVVIASSYSLDTGFARDLFTQWMTVSPDSMIQNTLLLTERALPGSLARQIYDDWLQQAIEIMNTQEDAQPRSLIKPMVDYTQQFDLTLFQRVPLEGAELKAFEEEQRAKAERDAMQAAIEARNRTIMEEDASDSSDMDEADDPMDDILVKQFDLYVRDNTRSAGFFKQAQSYHMFPFHDRRKKIDDYGEAIQADQYVLATDIERMLAVDGEGGSADMMVIDSGAATSKGAPDEKQPLLPARDTTPMKYTSSKQRVDVRCFVRYVDLEGLSDGRSINNILQQMAPRKLILVHGRPDATDALAQTCLAMPQFTKEVFTPTVGQVLNVSAATNVYRVRLTDALVNSLHFSKLGDYELARVHGRIHFQEDSTTPSLDVMSPASDEDGASAPADARQQPRQGEPTIFVGDIRLSEFKRVLQAEGVHAEFKGEGMLVCNDQVIIRKTGTGRLLIEGNLCDDYYRIRKLLYSQHAIL